MSNRWYVHLQGPDDLIPADGMLDAMRKAHADNASVLTFLEERSHSIGPHTPFSWAIPIMPGDETTAHITDDEDDPEDTDGDCRDVP